MDLEQNIKKILEYSFFYFIKDNVLKKLLKQVLIFFIIYSIVYAFLLNYFLGDLNVYTFVDFYTFANTFITYLAFFSLIGLFSILVISFFEYKIIQRILVIEKKPAKEINLKSYVFYIITPIIGLIFSIFCVYKKKLLLIGILSFVLTIMGFVSQNLLMFFIGLLIGTIYSFIIFYQIIRFNFAVIFVVSGKSILESLKKSWDLTKNNVLKILVIFFCYTIILLLISFFVNFPSSFYQFFDYNPFSTMNVILLIPSLILSGYFVVTACCLITKIYLLLNKKEKKKK